MQLAYRFGDQMVRQTLRLPTITTKFLSPEPDITRDAFFEHWKSFGGMKTHYRMNKCHPIASYRKH